MMRMGSTGILVNELGQVLLIRRNDTRTFAPPGGGLEAGELPPDNAAREVHEETGVIAMPVRLVGLYYWQPHKIGFLAFYFRCLRRGGELQPSAESPQVGFFPTNPLPGPMLPIHHKRIQQALTHAGGRPFWEWQRPGRTTRLSYALMRFLIYPFLDWRRKRQGRPIYQPPPIWEIGTTAIITNPGGQVLWLRNEEYWYLPGGAGLENRPPWETAVYHSQRQLQQSITLTNLRGVYPARDKAHMAFAFTATASNGPIPPGPNLAYFPPGTEPDNCLFAHKTQVADAFSPSEETIFRFQE
jgi:ADP-ribose pyrophosphatase YjhB (NUDIX family)